MDFEKLLRSVEAVEASNESQIREVLKNEGVTDEGVAVAQLVSRLFAAFSDEITPELLTKAVGVEVEEEEEVSKSDLEALPVAVRNRIEKALDERRELEKKVDELSDSFRKSEDERRLDSFVEKASAFGSLNKTAEEVGKVLKSVADAAGEDAAQEVVDLLTAANEVASKAEEDVLKSHGSAGSGPSDEIAKTEELARNIQKEQDISFSDALARVFDEHPELEKAYRANK